jgi:hypothetical protein
MRFQLLATLMTSLLKDRTDSERKEIISSVVPNATSAVGPFLSIRDVCSQDGY